MGKNKNKDENIVDADIVQEDHADDVIPTPDENTDAATDETPEGEMIPKATIDAYIKEQLEIQAAAMYEDKVSREQLAIEARRRIEDEAKDKHVALKKKSPEPWFEVVSDRVSADGQVAIELDWNDAFIEMLKEQKYEGITEEELVQKFLLLSMAQTAEEMDS